MVMTTKKTRPTLIRIEKEKQLGKRTKEEI